MAMKNHRKKGSIIFLSAAGGLFILGLVALVTDIGWLYYNKIRLQTAVNAGWKGGYDRMMELGGPPFNQSTRDLITKRVRDIVVQNGYTASEALSMDVTFPQNRSLKVANTQAIGLFFARVLDMNQANVNAIRQEAADDEVIGGIVPLGIPFGVVKDLDRNEFSLDLFDMNDPNSGFQEGGEYILKLGSGNTHGIQLPPDVDPQDFVKSKSIYGVIDPDNDVAGGANDYRDWFEYGFDRPLQINDRVMTQGGNESGPSDQAVDFRVNGDATASPARRVIIPITDIPPEVPLNNPLNASATSIYEIQGLDQPGGAYNPASYSFGSSVRIIGFAEFEILEPDEYTRSGGLIEDGDSGALGFYQTGQVRGKFVRYLVKPGEIALN